MTAKELFGTVNAALRETVSTENESRTDLWTASPPPALRTAAALTWRILPASRVHEALAIWRRLELTLQNQSLSCCSTWVDQWLQVYGHVVRYRFLIVEDETMPVAIVLVVESRQQVGPVQVRTLHLGTAGEPQPGSVCVEYNRLLIQPDYRQAVLAGLMQYVQANRRWEQLRLDGFTADDLALWQQGFPQAEIRWRDSRFCDLAAVRAAGGDLLSQLGRSTRSNLRRRLKHYGTLECEWAENLEQASDILQELIQLHQARWQAAGQPGAFASSRFLEFQQSGSLRLFLEQRVVLFRVRHEGATVGCLLLLNDGNRLLDYLSGFASFDEKPSPGLTTHYLCMEQALRRNFAAYDFLVGDKRHKDNLSNAVTQLGWLTCTRPSLKMQALQGLRILKRRAGSLLRKPAHAPCPSVETLSEESSTPTASI